MPKRKRQTAQPSRETLAHELETQQEEILAQPEQLRDAQAELEVSRDAYAELYDFAPIPYFTLNLAGIIQAVNLTGCTLLGQHRTGLLGMPFLSYLVAADRAEFLDHMRRCRHDHQAQSELRIRAPQGHELPMLMQSKVIGTLPACRTVLFDLTERKIAEAKIHELNASLEQRVQARTAELEAANRILLQEIEQRELAEQAL